MSDDLIKRSDAIKAVLWGNGLDGSVVDDICEKIDAISSADRPQGEWMHRNSYWHTAICSNCNKVTMFEEWDEEVIEYDFCPNCGARMKGADDE